MTRISSKINEESFPIELGKKGKEKVFLSYNTNVKELPPLCRMSFYSKGGIHIYYVVFTGIDSLVSYFEQSTSLISLYRASTILKIDFFVCYAE